MEAAFVVYLVSSLDDWKHNLMFMCVVVGFITFMIIFYHLLEDKPQPKFLVGPLVALFIVLAVTELVLPSKKTAEYMAAAYGVQYAVQSSAGQQVIDKSGKIVNNLLDRAIEKTGPSK